MKTSLFFTVVALSVPIAVLFGPSNIDPAHKFGWGENIGWSNWQHDAPNTGDGVVVTPTHLAGFVWAENVGWLNLGNGGGPYANDPADSATFGINVATTGDLFGLAWGENVGWINFDTSTTQGPHGQQARLDNCENRFRGYVWGENIGWINLDDATHFVAFAEEPIVVGGFDVSRGGETSLISGGFVDQIRAAIESAFPAVVLVDNNELTTSFLDTIDILLIHTPKSAADYITPLSLSEQNALIGFITQGGGALIFAEGGGTTSSDAANNSVLTPFEVVPATMTAGGTQPATVIDPTSHPVTDGPFGVVSNLAFIFAGWFTDLGPTAVARATLDANGQPCLATIEHGVLTSTAGGVVLLSDSSGFWDSELDSSEVALVQNALIALVSPTICSVPGDFTGNCNTDLTDYASFVGCAAGPDVLPDPPSPITPQQCLDAFDLDNDNDVDLLDFGGLQPAFSAP